VTFYPWTNILKKRATKRVDKKWRRDNWHMSSFFFKSRREFSLCLSLSVSRSR